MNGVVRAVVQARMSSRRFPGKVLAPFRRRPVIAHVLDRVAEVMDADRVVVATSTARATTRWPRTSQTWA